MALQLWTTVAPYSGYRSETIAWRLFPAVKHGRIRHFWDGERYMGFMTWAWFMEDEVAGDVWDGREVFAREGGDFVVLVDMIAPGGRDDVKFMVKEMRRHLSETYPDEHFLYAFRNGRRARFIRRD